ncbi:MAG TPA: mannonate dehydratase [Terriglobales bacterium]|jgi:mannonate dehydratase|nr:mannonate dehydratase [Terriglobales bacterium]
MNRRDFLHTAAAGALAAAATQVAEAQEQSPSKDTASKTSLPKSNRKKANLKLGTQHGDSDDILKAMAAFGVNHICAEPPSQSQSSAAQQKKDDDWSVDGLSRKREHIESFGLNVEALRLLHPTYITRSEIPNVMMGKGPERDREIDAICEKIRSAAKAGFPMLTYNLSMLGVVRTEPTPGRGGATYATFNYEQTADRDKLTEAGVVSAEQSWERIAYFLQRVVPVAEENKVRVACHPQDPAMPEPQGFRGVHRVLSTVDGLKKFIALSPSPYHGLNFCQGTICESLKNPNEEIHDAIRYFGSRGKIFNVHFRNIKGGFLNFQETLPDNGDVNFIRAIRTYKEVGYDGMLMPDHVPKIDGDTGGRQAFAYCFGYIQALIQMVNQEG